MSFIKKVKTYIINLKERADRRLHILQEFKNKEGFDIELVQAIKNKNGAVGLLNSYQKCVKDALVNAHKFIIICPNASFTHEESLGFKDPFISNWSIERFIEETHPTIENKQVYRLYRMNPFCFWRWYYYSSTSRNFEYKSWKEIEPNRAPYNPEDRWQDF